MNENVFLLHAFLLGVEITFLYDILRILRRVFVHGNGMVSLEDIAFWIYCAGKVFLLMFRESNGNLRWFAVLGAVLGMYLYHRTLSPLLVKYVSGFLNMLLNPIRKALRIAVRWVKKKLTRLRKMLRIFIGDARMARGKRRVAYRRRHQNRFSLFLVSLVVLMIMVVVAVRSVELQQKIAGYDTQIASLSAQIDAETARAEEIEEYRKYTQTKAYVEEVAKDKLGLVYEGEILFKEDN